VQGARRGVLAEAASEAYAYVHSLMRVQTGVRVFSADYSPRNAVVVDDADGCETGQGCEGGGGSVMRVVGCKMCV
jgi:hypothetical protein